jgi:hypothetical protein
MNCEFQYTFTTFLDRTHLSKKKDFCNDLRELLTGSTIFLSQKVEKMNF